MLRRRAWPCINRTARVLRSQAVPQLLIFVLGVCLRVLPNNTFLVRLRSNTIQHVRGASFEIRGEHLVFLMADGTLSALFLFSIVESWNEIEPGPNPP